MVLTPTRNTSVVAERAEALAAVSASEIECLARQQFGLSPAPHAISTVGEKSALLVRVNSAYQDLVGKPMDRLLGLQLVGPIAIDDAARERRMHCLEVQGSYVSERAVIQHSSGKGVEVLISARRLRLEGEVFDIEAFTDVTSLLSLHRRQIEDVEALAFRDSVTGLMNRAGFEAEFARHIGFNGLFDVAVAVIELSGFHKIGNSYGHMISNAMLKEFAVRFQSTMLGKSTIARIGEDEFAVMIRGSGLSVAALEQKLFSILCDVFAPVSLGRLELSVGAALGIAHAEEALSSPKLLLSLADDRMCAAKSTGQHVVMIGRTFAMGL